MKKRILSALIASAMTISTVAVPVFADKLTVAFDSNDGTAIYSIEVDENEVLHELPLPDSQEGKIFAGWYTDKLLQNEFDISKPVTATTTLYAKWMDEMPYTDVPETHQFYDAIDYVYANEIMNGVGDNKFDPDGPLTRAMLVTILYRYEGEPETGSKALFKDVEPGQWYEKAVQWAFANALVTGFSDVEFGPDVNITREQLAAISTRYAEFKLIDVAEAIGESVVDATDFESVEDYAEDAVNFCYVIGALTDRKPGMVMPQADATRAEAANVIMKLSEYVLSAVIEDIITDPYTYAQLEGSYMDSTSQRAIMKATNDNDHDLKFDIKWSSSATEYSEWKMSTSYDKNSNDKLVYKDCVKTNYIVDEKGNPTSFVEYQDGSGYFTVDLAGNISWEGAAEESVQGCVFVQSEEEPVIDDDVIIGMPNPVTEIDEKKATELFSFNLPKGAKEIKYSLINDGTDTGMLQIAFKLNNADMTFRIGTNFDVKDISGMYYPWTVTEAVKVMDRDGSSRRFLAKDLTIDAITWVDVAPGLVYSLTAQGKDLNGFDIKAIAEQMFVPAQGDVDGEVK